MDRMSNRPAPTHSRLPISNAAYIQRRIANLHHHILCAEHAHRLMGPQR
jgi:hypothetical protein